MKEKISAVYQIKNKVTGERYIGSSKNVYERWWNHKCQSVWDKYPNSKLYKDLQKYGVENFLFAILAPVEPEHLKEVEQDFIDMLKPTYNDKRANGLDIERRKASQKAREQTKKRKVYHIAYDSQLCSYNGKTLTLRALISRFFRVGIPHATLEAKKYLLHPID